jgi:acyl-CoA synthetase (AMP-forming)/AMP-acid ligase II
MMQRCAIRPSQHGQGFSEIGRVVAFKIARYKIPCYVRFMTSFPMTVTGKVAKYLLREQVAHELSAHEKEAP